MGIYIMPYISTANKTIKNDELEILFHLPREVGESVVDIAHVKHC